MPNYSLQINSRFRPFSFQEMVAPWQLYGQAYKELADSYTSLGVQAGDVASMLNKELDKEAYNQYENYMQGIRDNANILASEGLNPTLRNNVYNLTNRYAQEIRPIQKAAERRQLLAEEQRKLGPGYAFEYDASTTGLDKFMNNPVFTPKQINLADVRQRSAAEFGTLAKQLRSFKENPNMYRKGFDSTVLAEYGYSPEDAARVAESIRRGEVSPEDAAASAIYNSIYGSTGVDSWSNNLNVGQQAVRNAIAEGVVGAIGQMTPQIVTDKVGLEREKARIELQSYKDKLAAQYEFNQAQMNAQMLEAWDPNIEYLTQAIGINPASVSHTIDSNKIKQYKDKGWVDDYGNITSKGIVELKSPDNNLITDASNRSTKRTNDSKYTLPTEAELAQIGEYTLSQSFKSDYGKYNIPNIERVGMMRVHVKGDNSAALTDMIKSKMGNASLYSVGRLDEQTGTVTKGKELKRADFIKKIKDGDKITFIGNMPYSGQQFFQMTDGQWYFMPENVFSDYAFEVIQRNNALLRQENLTPAQEALYGNNIMTMLSQPLNEDVGNDIKRNNTTIQIPLE